VSFTVRRGEAVALLGGPGAGKSQLLRCIGLDFPPVSGSVHVDGVEVSGTTGEPRRQLRAQAVELVHAPNRGEDPDSQVPTPRRGVPLQSRPATVPVAGMRQRIQISRALTQGAPVLLLDEPFHGVDDAVRRRILELVDRARAAAGTAVVVATREIEVVRSLADRVVVLHDGEIAEAGPVDGVLEAPRDPRTRVLLDSRRSA
jgi:ABC-type glutathione transport system ATPase component